MSAIRCWVKVDGEIRHDELCVNDKAEVDSVSYAGLKVLGQQIEVGFDFDPPLIRPAAASTHQQHSGKPSAS